MRLCPLVVAVLISLTAPAIARQASEQQPQVTDPASPEATGALLKSVFTEALRPDQLTSLRGEPTLGMLVAAMTPDEKQAARSKLKKLEKAASPDQLNEIQRGYEMLGASADSLRIDLRRRGLLPEDVSEQTKAASAAYDAGRVDDAVRLAAEALARNPDDKAALAIFLLAKQMRRLTQIIGLLEQASDAESAGRHNQALALAEQAAAIDPNPVIRKFAQALRSKPVAAATSPVTTTSKSSNSVPPVVPIGAGGLLLAIGYLLWRVRGREAAEAWRADVKRSAALGAVGLGVALMFYGGWTMLGAAAPTPALALAGSATTVGAVAVDAGALSQGALVAAGGAKLAGDGISYAKASENDEPIETTKHGAERLSDRNPTRGGVLSTDEVKELKEVGRVMEQRDGAKVFLREVEPGKFNVYIESEEGKVITTYRHIRPNKLQNLARNYGWSEPRP